MATTFLGSVGLAGAFPGFVAVLTPLRSALGSLRAQAQAALASVAQVKAKVQAAVTLAADIDVQLEAALGVHLEALLGFKLSIRLLALADLEVQLQAALALEASLGVTVTDPTAYISGLISAVAAVKVDLAALVPTVLVNAQLSAALSLKASLTAKIAAFDLALDAIVQIGASLKVALSAVLSVSAQISAALSLAVEAMAALTVDLQAALDLVVAPLGAAVALEASLTAGPVVMVRYDGTRGALGAGLDVELAASSGLPAGDGVRAWLLVVPDSNPNAQLKLGALLKAP
jgi:hypothetical protein